METTLLATYTADIWVAEYLTPGTDGLPWVNEAWLDLPAVEKRQILNILLDIYSTIASRNTAAVQEANHEAECSECYTLVRATALKDGACPDCTDDINWGTGAWN